MVLLLAFAATPVRAREQQGFKAYTTDFKAQAAKAKARASQQSAAIAKMPKRRYGSRTLRKGMAGTDVLKLQKYLNGLQLPTTVDGVFGQTTRRSVVGWETSRTLLADGVVPGKQAKKIRVAAKKARLRSSGHVFPVLGAHNFGGPGAAFGAPRQGHTHQGHDVFAACATPLVAAQGGAVRVNAYQAGGAGYYVVIRGATSGQDYVYMHMTARSAFAVGAVVGTGQVIGSVGATGNATGGACHLHFELWTAPGWYLGGYPYDPLPSLLLWDSYS